MTNLDDNLLKQLEGLRKAFIAELPTRLERIEKLLSECASNDFDRSSLETLNRNCHNVAGTSATHQLTHITQAAREVENYIRPYLDDESLSPPIEEEKLGTLIAELQSQIEITTTKA